MKIIFNKIGLLGIAAVLAACANNVASPQEEATSFATSAPATTSIASSALSAGLYQAAYSAKNDVLWVTAAVGRPPVTSSSLIKVDPRTRQPIATYTPPVLDSATGGLEAVYGVAVDDAHDRVWVTNTRNNSVAVYSQTDGQHIASFPNVPHAREVLVDEARHTAWASAFSGAALVAYDTNTLQETRRVAVDGSGPTGLVVDHQTGTLYAADLTKSRIIVVSADVSTPPRLIAAEGGPISIDISADGHTLYTADQAAGRLSVYDVVTGTATKRVPTGAGALAVALDPTTGKVLVANRTAATISVVDVASGTVTETLPTNPNPNHIAIGGGSAFVVDKSAAGADRKDTLYTLKLGH